MQDEKGEKKFQTDLFTYFLSINDDSMKYAAARTLKAQSLLG